MVLSLAACVTPQGRDVLPRAPFTADEEAIYQQRNDAYAKAVVTKARLDVYDPVEAVPGVDQPSPLPRAKAPHLPADAVEAAVDYARNRSSSALLVWRSGGVEIERYFGAYGRSTPIVSKALAKPLAVMLVGRAIALGKIASVEQPVADYIHEWRDDPVKATITIRQLLEMRSGLLPQSFGKDAPEILRRSYMHPRHDSIMVHDYPVTDKPGERFEYSNANSELIALIIERATGRRYAEFLGNDLLAPIGAAGGDIWVNRPGGLAHSGCCLTLPPESWLRLGILLLNDGKWDGKALLPAEFVAMMKTATTQNPHFGMGLWVAGPYVERRGYLNPANSLGAVLHSQPYLDAGITLFDGNGNQVMYIIPSVDMVVLRTGEFPPAALEWDNSYLPNLLISAALEVTGQPRPEPQRRARPPE